MVASHDIIFGDKLQESVVTAIVKLCLKSLQEFVRLHTFNRSGFQQVQLDILFLRTPFREIVEDEAAVDFLLDEVWRNSVHVVITFQICVMVIQRLEFLLCLFDFFLNLCTGDCCYCWAVSRSNSIGASHSGQTYTSKVD